MYDKSFVYGLIDKTVTTRTLAKPKTVGPHIHAHKRASHVANANPVTNG
jgi:hypothetical protein